MFQKSGLIRWLAVVVYATSLLGALIAPHNHGWGQHSHDCGSGTCCSAAAPSSSADPVKSDAACHHSSSRHRHDHSHDDQGHGDHDHDDHRQKDVASTSAPQSGESCSDPGDGNLPHESPFHHHDHHNCEYCKFLAQVAHLSEAPLIDSVSDRVTEWPISSDIAGAPLSHLPPPARGPPAV